MKRPRLVVLLARLRGKVEARINGHDERGRRAWLDLLDEIDALVAAR